MEQQKLAIKKNINKVYLLSDQSFELLLEKCHISQYKKGKLILSAGEVDQQFRLVLSGLVKTYQISENGKKESINWLINEGGVACSVISLFKQIPSSEYIETIEDSLLICIKYHDLNELIDKQPEICKLIGKWMMEFLVKYDKRISIYRNARPEQKLEILMKAQPELMNRLSKKEIASYLDIAPGTLSATFHKLKL